MARRHDATRQGKKLTALLKQIVTDSEHPDPAEQRRRSLLLFFDKAKPRGGTDRDLESFVLEVYGFWFAHTYDDLLESPPASKKKLYSEAPASKMTYRAVREGSKKTYRWFTAD
jgi:hypothetical protein